MHCLIVARGRCPSLRLEPFPLDYRIDEFGVSGGQLDVAHVQVPLLGDARNAEESTGKRGGLHREVSNEGRRPYRVPDGVLPQFLDQFPVPVAAVPWNLHTELI